MTDLISVLAPTRGRPAALQEMADSVFRTAENVEVLAYVDDDDPADYSNIEGVRIITGPRVTLSDCWNRLAAEADGTILGMGSDDIRYRTPGWDTSVRAVINSFTDRIVFVYTEDGIHNERLGTHGFVSREWVEAAGMFTWPGFAMDYADTWLNDIARRIHRAVFIPGVMVEHLHPIAGKAEWDQTHRERLARGVGMGDLWNRLEPERVRIAGKLKEVMV